MELDRERLSMKNHLSIREMVIRAEIPDGYIWIDKKKEHIDGI